MNNKQSRPEHTTLADNGFEWEIEAMIEEVWHRLEGRVNRTEILQVLLGILPKYEDARVTLYLPILVHREVVAVLRALLDEGVRVKPIPAAGTQSTDAAPDGHLVEPNEPTTAEMLPASS